MPVRLGIVAFVLGVILLQRQAALPAISIVIILPLLLVAVVLSWQTMQPKLQTFSQFLFLLLLLGCGYFWAAAMAHIRLADALPEVWEGKDIQVIGVVSNLPQSDSGRIRFQLDIEQILTPKAYVPQRVLLSWYSGHAGRNDAVSVLPRIRAGERWQLTIRLKRPHSFSNPHGFDYEAWLLERNIRAVGYVRQSSDNISLEAHTNRLSSWVVALRQQIQQRFDTNLTDRSYAGVLMTLATGDQRAIPFDQWQIFTRTGTNHLMAISGLHITLVASLAYALAFMLWRRSMRLLLYMPARRVAAMVGLIAAFVYALLSGFAIPAQRAFFMLAVVAAAIWYGRVTAPSMVLAWALLLVVVIDPWAVLSPGFWLSFCAVSIILLVTVGRIGSMHWLGGWLRVQWAITLGLLPVLLVSFQQASLVSPIANAVAIPLISLAVVPLTLLAVIPFFEFLLPLAHGVLSIVMGFLQILNDLPQPVWQQHAPPTWALIAAAIGMVWLLLPGSLGINFLSGFPARWLGFVAMLPLFLVSPPRPVEGALWLTVLDVGQGLAVVAQTSNHTLLFDSGPAYADSDSAERIIIPVLRASGINQLDRMIISHADSDHSGGALSVFNALEVESLSSSLDDDHPISKTARQSEQCVRGQSWQWDGVDFEMLHPTADIYQNPKRQTNPSSCVLKISTATNSILIPADIDRRVEQLMLEAVAEKLPSTVLVAPHHGSLTSSSRAFVQQVNPVVTVFTVGYRNRFSHPRDAVVERYRQQGSAVLRSDRDGAVLIRFEPEGFFVHGWRQMRQRYWQQKDFVIGN